MQKEINKNTFSSFVFRVNVKLQIFFDMANFFQKVKKR